MTTINFDNLIGEKGSLYYCNQANRFQLGRLLFEVVEDEKDGYRSSMKEVKIVDDNPPTQNILDSVIIKNSEAIEEGYDIVSEDGFVWLTFGTDRSDSYYPTFIFQTFAKKSIDDIKNLIK